MYSMYYPLLDNELYDIELNDNEKSINLSCFSFLSFLFHI